MKKLIKGKVGEDAYGTKATDYIELFQGYEIPDSMEEVDFKTYV